jgi:hypothetical protein
LFTLLYKRYFFPDFPVIAEMAFWKGGGKVFIKNTNRFILLPVLNASKQVKCEIFSFMQHPKKCARNSKTCKNV